MPPVERSVIYLRPPKGPTLVLKEKETWIGRCSFALSEKAQLLCSRRQACLKYKNTVVELECHGLNPIYFVVCHSVKFAASQDTPLASLHLLRKGEVVELANGDKFYLAPRECLLTVGIRLFKPGGDEAALQRIPVALHLNIHDERPPADAVVLLKSTQNEQALAISPVEKQVLLQTGGPSEPLPATARIPVANRCSTGDICNLNPPRLNDFVCPADEGVKVNVLGISVVPPGSGLQGPSIEKQVRLHTGGPAEPLPAKVSVTKVANRCLKEDICNLNPPRLNGFVCPTDEGDEVKVLGNCPDPPWSRLQVPSVKDHRIHPVVSSKLAASGDLPGSEIAADARRSVGVSNGRKTTVNDGSLAPEVLGLDLSATGVLHYSTSEGIEAAGSYTERRGHASVNDTSGEIFAEGRKLDSSECGSDLRDPSDIPEICRINIDEGSKPAITSIASSSTTCRLFPNPKHIQEDKPSANIFRLESQQGPLQCLPSGTSGSPHISHASSIPGTECEVEVATCSGDPVILKTSQKQGNMQAGNPLESVSSFGTLPLDRSSSRLPTGMFEVDNVLGGSGLPPKQSEPVNLASFENEGNAGACIQSQNVCLGHSIPNSYEMGCIEGRGTVTATGAGCDNLGQSHSQIVDAEQSVSNNYGTGPVEGMETVIATVSGYDNLVRARLINLINLTGAVYTGSLTKSNTHVVCWKFKGSKYEMARKLGKSFINHVWFEDCLKAGRRLSEGPYQSSGEVAEPLHWDQSCLQHPSSKAGEALTTDRHTLRLLHPTFMIGESSDGLTHNTKMSEHSGEIALPPRSDLGSLNRGKRHLVVDLSSPSSSEEAGNPGTHICKSQDICQIRSLTRAVDAPANNPSTFLCAREQESDEFWNEVIRAYDDRDAANFSCQVVPVIDHNAELKEQRTRQAASAIIGSSSRENPDLEDEIRHGDASANRAFPTPNVHVEGVCEELQADTSVREQSGNIQSQDDDITDYPDVLSKKRKHIFAGLSDHHGGHRRLVRKCETMGELPRLEGRMAGIVGGIHPEGQPTYVTSPTQQRASTVGAEPECAESTVVIDTLEDSVVKTEICDESSPSSEITCVICHSETKSITEGVLTCGHEFCYPCIQRWADEAKYKSPACPLCKLPFEFITFREMGNAGADGSCSVLEERVVQVGKDASQETRRTNLPSLRTENLCVTCGSRDTPELLLICTNCRERACHTFCLDPPRPPGSAWFCSRCFQMQSRMQTRQAYGRLFQGSSPRSAPQRRQDTVDMALNPMIQNRITMALGQSSRTPPRRGRQHSLYNYLVRPYQG